MSVNEPTLLRLKFLGQPFGVLAYRPDLPAYALELDRTFLASGHELSPLNLPIATFAAGPRLFRSGDTPFTGGLPGLIADSLPDAWGERMLRQEASEIKSAIGKLAVIGQRGPGALTFEPVLGHGADQTPASANLAELAHEVDILRASPALLTTDRRNSVLAKGGTSLGGAFPKTAAHLHFEGEIIERREILVGGEPPPDYSPCILKFARSSDEAEGAVEFAFWLMAKQAGIRLPRACLVHDGERHHFACERFDRYRRADGTVGRRHAHSLRGMVHRRASDGAIDYEEYMRLSRRLGGASEGAECYQLSTDAPLARLTMPAGRVGTNPHFYESVKDNRQRRFAWHSLAGVLVGWPLWGPVSGSMAPWSNRAARLALGLAEAPQWGRWARALWTRTEGQSRTSRTSGGSPQAPV